jgi:hypothetical protein
MQLHLLLLDLVEKALDFSIDAGISASGTSVNVYFEPPEAIKMKYPCIRYSRSKIDGKHANNSIYSKKTRYEVIVIEQDPDGILLDAVFALSLCAHEQSYAIDGLKHDVFTLYY